MPNQIEKNLSDINLRINNACKTFEIKASNVNLVAVSKTVAAEKILLAIDAGCKVFGENYVKEVQEKWPEIKRQHPEIKLHLIGHLQSNKAREAVAMFDCIESLDSKKLAKELQKEIARANLVQSDDLDTKLSGDDLSQKSSQTSSISQNANNFNKNPEIFIQVNIGEEPQKSGILPLLTKDFVNFARNECKLNIVGLMAVPPANEEASPYFALLAKMAKENGLSKISMGMSADFEEAIAMGATHVRVGTAIFGAR